MSSWRHRAGDAYVPLCYYPQGSLENWRSEIIWRGEGCSTRRQAWAQGLKAVGCDDFNIAVFRGGRCVGWLHDSEIVDDDPAFLNRMTAEIAEVAAS